MILKRIIWLALLCCVASLLSADERLKIRIAGYDYPPLYYLNEAEDIEGVFYDVIKRMCVHQNYDCDFMSSSAARSYRQLEDQAIDVLLTGKIKRFSDCCQPTEWSYLWTGGVYSRYRLAPPIDSSSLVGKSLVIPLGLELPFFVFKELRLQEEQKLTRVVNARTARLTLKMFGKGRGDFVWSSSETEPLLQEYTDTPGVEYYFYPLVKLPVVAWVHSSNPKYNQIIKGFNQAYRELTARKEIAANGLLVK